MILEFATKRNPNGYRKYLGIDTTNKTYSRERGHWMCREDFAEVTLSDLRKLQSQCEEAGYTQIDFMMR